MLYDHDILKGRYDSVKLSNYCNFNTSCTRAHPLSLVPLQSSINSYRHSFFVNTVFLWNTLPCDAFDLSFSKLCINCFVVINLYVYVFFLGQTVLAIFVNVQTQSRVYSNICNLASYLFTNLYNY